MHTISAKTGPFHIKLTKVLVLCKASGSPLLSPWIPTRLLNLLTMCMAKDVITATTTTTIATNMVKDATTTTTTTITTITTNMAKGATTTTTTTTITTMKMMAAAVMVTMPIAIARRYLIISQKIRHTCLKTTKCMRV